MSATPIPHFPPNRRRFLRDTALWMAAAATIGTRGRAADVVLPFGNGERSLATYPGKRPLILLTARPPQLETPFAVFNDGVITPNDAFFVRYHLSGVPTEIDPGSYRLAVEGAVERSLRLSLEALKALADPVEVVAVNQCSGNSRGFSQPRVGGGQLGHGAMGNARWTGIPLKAVLEHAGLRATARQVTIDGLDRPVLPKTPDFVKALDIDHACDGEVLLAYAMNGQDLPMLNGYPLRLIVPGYYGTYWVKHVSRLNVVESEFDGFWMKPAYRIPDNPTHSVPPGEKPVRTVPIGRFNIRSFITSVAPGTRLGRGRSVEVRGIAFDGGIGVTEVQFSIDGGRSWSGTRLGDYLGRYSFREWRATFTPKKSGDIELASRAFNRSGESQPLEPLWNPSGYMRNVVERVPATIA